MKVHPYARNMTLNRKYGKSRQKHKIFIFFKLNGFYLSQMFYSPLGYLAGIMV